MWKHKNFINLQLWAVPPELFSVTIDGEDVSVSTTGGRYTWEYCLNSYFTITSTNVLYNSKVLQYNSVDVLPTDQIVSGGEYTTRTATPSLTFKHFYDAGTIGSGTYKFRHYSQQEPSSGETWVLNETIDTATLGTYYINFTTVGTSITNWKALHGAIPPALEYYPAEGDGALEVYSESSNTWTNEAYRTITFATAPTGDLLTWLQANGTKQGGGGGSN